MGLCVVQLFDIGFRMDKSLKGGSLESGPEIINPILPVCECLPPLVTCDFKQLPCTDSTSTARVR